jgi:hypothetical protein
MWLSGFYSRVRYPRIIVIALAARLIVCVPFGVARAAAVDSAEAGAAAPIANELIAVDAVSEADKDSRMFAITHL